MINAIKIIVLFLVALSIATDNKDAVQLIDGGLTGLIGAVLGGVTAGVAIILTIIAKHGNRFTGLNHFLTKLERDIQILVLCLFLSIFVPFIKLTGVPFISFPVNEIITRLQFFNAVSISLVVISCSLIYEIVSIMFILAKEDVKLSK